MTDFNKLAGVYFVGIGGIGMSALARWFISKGCIVSGYDKTESPVTETLENEGCSVTYNDNPETIPALFTNISLKDKIIVVFTPAIPPENKILQYFMSCGYAVYKRAEVLGEISHRTNTLAVAGTHGKTTVSTLLAHILYSSASGCSAFLGGISRNYNTNLLISDSPYTVIEADEYDRSFHKLSPIIAVVTSADADHLDIYGDYRSMLEAYNEFCHKIRPNGILLLNEALRDRFTAPRKVTVYTYGFSSGSSFRISNLRREGDLYVFDLIYSKGELKNLKYPFPGKMNIENAAAASSIALMCNTGENEIRDALLSFSGVKRRFDIRINKPGLLYIDDYAHHPEEIKAFITSVREHYGNRKITAIFQPHLFSRTRDHAEGFAAILDKLDEVILLPVYPAREKPVEGITSAIIFDRMKLKNKKMLEMSQIPSELDLKNIDILLTIGAGDIDRLVAPVEQALKRLRQE
ncbi:MAG: UDP-N-acetylmuramate--L-alanine ligase [Bacteroidales bacterium]